MENPRGRVIAVSCTASRPYALVEVDASVQCARCIEGKGCGAGVFGSAPRSRRVDALIPAQMTIAPGDEVRIELASKNLLRASLIVYGAPLSGALVAVLLAYAARLSDPFTILAAIAGMAFGILLARIRLRNERCLSRFKPTVVAKIEDERISALGSPTVL